MNYRKKTLFLLLLTALVLGSVAWAPHSGSFAGDEAAAAANTVKLTAKVVQGRLVVNGKYFPNKRWYTVVARTPQTPGWVVLGEERSSAKGKVRADFRMPRDFYTARSIRVCLVEMGNPAAQHCAYYKVGRP